MFCFLPPPAEPPPGKAGSGPAAGQGAAAGREPGPGPRGGEAVSVGLQPAAQRRPLKATPTTTTTTPPPLLFSLFLSICALLCTHRQAGDLPPPNMTWLLWPRPFPPRLYFSRLRRMILFWCEHHCQVSSTPCQCGRRGGGGRSQTALSCHRAATVLVVPRLGRKHAGGVWLVRAWMNRLRFLLVLNKLPPSFPHSNSSSSYFPVLKIKVGHRMLTTTACTVRLYPHAWPTCTCDQ